MPINFPNSPSLGDTHSANGKTWMYDGEKWILSNGNAGAIIEDLDGGILGIDEAEVSGHLIYSFDGGTL